MDKKWTNNDVLYAYTNRWRYVLLLLVLNHPPDIMAAISQTIYSWIFVNEKFIPTSPIDNDQALV